MAKHRLRPRWFWKQNITAVGWTWAELAYHAWYSIYAISAIVLLMAAGAFFTSQIGLISAFILVCALLGVWCVGEGVCEEMRKRNPRLGADD